MGQKVKIFFENFFINILIQVYDGGRYFVWLAHYFISFPGTYQTIEFSTYTGANCKKTKIKSINYIQNVKLLPLEPEQLKG